MIVLKFGGSSVSDAVRIRRVIEIVRARLDRKPVIVVSALRGVTDALLQLAESALQGSDAGLEPLRQRHRALAADLGVPFAPVEPLFEELPVLLKGISLIKELTPRTRDYVASFGERLSARIIAEAFSAAGIPAHAHDAFDIGMETDDSFGGAFPLPGAAASLARHVASFDRLGIVTGYIGKTRNGDITTLGRNGSDFTATILGAAIGAQEIQIWSDTDGIMTADPRLVPEARPIRHLSFEEASELAYYGGKVLHPSTLIPAIERHIPIRVLNTFKPDHPGTLILAEPEDHTTGVKSIAHHPGNFVLNITSSRMLMGHGFLARIFEVFARHRIVINMVSTSEVSVSVTTDRPDRLDQAVEELRTLGTVSVERGRAILCIVGEGLRTLPGISGDVFGTLREAGVNVLMISQGASKINLAFVIADEDVSRAVQALHQTLFVDSKSPVGSAS